MNSPLPPPIAPPMPPPMPPRSLSRRSLPGAGAARVAAVLAAVVVLVVSGCGAGGDAESSAATTPGGVSCADLEEAEAESGSEAEFFAAMAMLAESAGVALGPDDGSSAVPADAPEGADGDVAAAFRRLASASEEFSEAHPAAGDQSGEAFEALDAEAQAAYEAELAEMLEEFDDDFELTWAWLGEVESQLDCGS